MSTPFNPSNLTTNCGFCAIAYGLSLRGIRTDADALYFETIERLGFVRVGPHDPIPRQLIFPEPLLDEIRLPVQYAALAEHGQSASSYTITSVAMNSGLQFDAAETRPALPNQFLDFYARKGPGGGWSIDEFVQARIQFLRTNSPRDAVKRHIMTQLGGHSIIGSKKVNHFINMHIATSGHISAFDAQDGREYSGTGLKARLGTIDLFMQLRGMP